MNKLIVSLLLTVGISGIAHAAGDATAGQAKAAVCGACHGPDGNSMAPNFPKLAGQGERYLNKQLHDIKSGKRTVLEMTGLLTNLSDQDLADISAYFASQKGSVVKPCSAICSGPWNSSASFSMALCASAFTKIESFRKSENNIPLIQR